MEENKKMAVSLAAIDTYVASNIVSSAEKEIKGGDFVEWGTANRFPQYLFGLCQDVTLLRTIINGIADYVAGENIVTTHTAWEEQVNKDGDTIEDLVKALAQDFAKYGGFAINVIRNKIGGIAELYYIDLGNLRSDKKNEFFFYSEDWNKSYGRVKYVKYPKFRYDSTEFSSIYYYKNTKNAVYPISPIAGDGIVAAETEKSIQRYHLNSIKNGFSASAIINFNNGVPDDEDKDELEKNINEKFAGEENAGRLMVSFNTAKDNEVTVTKLDIENFRERYQALSKSCKQEIYTAYRVSPQLFGLPMEGTGFNDQDYSEAFKIFNHTVIEPYQKAIKRAFEKILGEKDVITIMPFSIDFTEDAKEDAVK